MDSSKLYYSLRLDGEHTVDQLEELRSAMDAKGFCIEQFLMYHETGDVTGKHHSQGMVVMNLDKIDKTLYNSFRWILRSKFGITKASEFSFTVIKTYDGYTRYIVKQGECLVRFGVTDEMLQDFEKRQQEWIALASKKEAKNRKSSNPHEALLNWFKDTLENECAKYNVEHVDRKEPHEFATDHFITSKVMEWYGTIAIKPFAMKMMGDVCTMIKYNVLTGDSKKEFVGNLQSRMIQYMNMNGCPGF